MVMHSYKRRRAATYPCRSLSGSIYHAVDVLKILHAPTDQVSNVRHLRVQHTFSLVTSSSFLIQQDGEVVDEFRQHDSMVMVMVKLSP